MAAPFTKTNTPGIYKRGERYYSTWTVNGRLRKKSHRTMKDARAHKAHMQTLVNAGEYQEQSKVKFRDYALEWIERYQGNGKAGFREWTRDDYRRDLRWYATPFFHDQLGRRLTAIAPKDVSEWIRWLCDEEEQGRRRFEEKCRRAKEAGKPRPRGGPKSYPLADATVKRIVSPVRACLSTARDEGLIRHNPVDGVKLPHRPQPQEDEEPKAKAFTHEQLSTVMALLANSKHRLLFVFLRGTGLRWSEVAALQWGDLQLDGSNPVVRVRRSLVRGKIGALKSKYARRDVPLSANLVHELRTERKRVAPDDGRLLFVNEVGAALDHGNVLRRILRPALEEADASWPGVGFHAFRHTYASLLFERGANVVLVQRRLGHHSPQFTMNTYIHLLEDKPGEALEFDDIGGVGRREGSEPSRTHRNPESGAQASASLPEPLSSDPTGLHRG